MPSEAETMNRRIEEIREPGEAVPVLVDIRRLRNENRLTDAECIRLFSQLFHDLKGHADLLTAHHVIHEYLIPLCLEDGDKYEPRERINLSAYRKLLADWISQFPRPERESFRDEVCDKLRIALSTGRAQEACWTISEVGYRSEAIVESLWPLTERHDKPAGVALSTIVSLGAPPPTRDRVFSLLKDRNWSKDRLAFVLSELAGVDTLDMARSLFRSPDKKEVSLEDFFHVQVLAAHADADPNDERIQTSVLSSIDELRRFHLERFPEKVFLGDKTTTHVNSSLVISTLLETLTPGDSDALKHSRYRVYLPVA